jgi:transcriptional regulator with XRE-family HTH domain
MNLKEISKIIKEKRKLKKWSQQTLSSYANINVNTIQKMEAGFMDEVGITKVEAVLDILNLELSLREKGRPMTLDELNG